LGRARAEGTDQLRREALTFAGRLPAQTGLHDLAEQVHEEAIGIAPCVI